MSNFSLASSQLAEFGFIVDSLDKRDSTMASSHSLSGMKDNITYWYIIYIYNNWWVLWQWFTDCNFNLKISSSSLLEMLLTLSSLIVHFWLGNTHMQLDFWLDLEPLMMNEWQMVNHCLLYCILLLCTRRSLECIKSTDIKWFSPYYTDIKEAELLPLGAR